ncbi:urease accessory protein UreD [Cystobacter ferrugineus]|nr:urease accessory protein UreD [Cystobacter ferrugineus]
MRASQMSSEQSPPEVAVRPGRASQARLAFERVGKRTIVSRARAKSPVRLLTPRNHGHAAWVYTSLLGDGLVDGDHLSLELDVAEGASALLSSRGHTRVYRSPHGCRSEVVARVGEGALLVWVPDPTTCYTGARYEQRLDIQLAPGASLVLMELVTTGRKANGERWTFSRFSSSLRVHREGRALFDECWLLDPAQGEISERLGRFDAIGTVLLVGPACASARESLASGLGALPITPRAGLICSASPISPDGLVLRAAAVSPELLQHTAQDWLSFLPSMLGDNPWAHHG